MSAKPTARKKKTSPSQPRSPGKRSGLTLAVPPPSAAEAAAVTETESPAVAEDVAEHLIPAGLDLSENAASKPVPEVEPSLTAAEPTAAAAAKDEPAAPMAAADQATPSPVPSEDPPRPPAPTLGDANVTLSERPANDPELAPAGAHPGPATQPERSEGVELWLQRLARTLPIGDWAFAALRTLTGRTKLLGAIDLLLPESGRLLDLSGAAGLPACYLAQSAPARQIIALQPSEALLHRGERLVSELGLNNVSLVLGDLPIAPVTGEFDAIYAIDSLHRLPPSQLASTLRRLASWLRPGGVLVIKEISSASYIGPSLTQILERVLDSEGSAGTATGSAYRHHDEWLALLRDAGLRARLGHLPDLLQPHILLSGSRPSAAAGATDA